MLALTKQMHRPALQTNFLDHFFIFLSVGNLCFSRGFAKGSASAEFSDLNVFIDSHQPPSTHIGSIGIGMSSYRSHTVST
jgi:hypothetical protein